MYTKVLHASFATLNNFFMSNEYPLISGMLYSDILFLPRSYTFCIFLIDFPATSPSESELLI